MSVNERVIEQIEILAKICSTDPFTVIRRSTELLIWAAEKSAAGCRIVIRNEALQRQHGIHICSYTPPEDKLHESVALYSHIQEWLVKGGWKLVAMNEDTIIEERKVET